MGCNFYTTRDKHIGKRSAAGMYCWDCGITLCKAGEKGVHMGEDWYDECPRCDQKPEKEKLEESSAGRELGFNKSKPKKKKGVASCSSFTWAVRPAEILLRIKKVKDEYDRVYSREEFVKILSECPIQYTDSIGVDFS